MDIACCFPPAYNKPFVTILSGKSWAGPQHSYRDMTLKSYSIIKVVDFIGDNKGNKSYINSCTNYTKDGNDNNINNFLFFEKILYKEKWKRVLNYKYNIAEPIYNSN